ncbi:MAG: hypothetical protein ACI4MY_05590, partial [Christensenellales bacterium]
MSNKTLLTITYIILVAIIAIFIWTSFVSVLTWSGGDVPDVAAIGFEDLHSQSLSINDQLQRLATATDPDMSAEDKNAFRDSVIANPPYSITRQYQSVVAKMTLRWLSIALLTILAIISLVIVKNATAKQSIFSRRLSRIVLIWGIFMILSSTILPLLEGVITVCLTGTFSLAINFMLLFCGLAVIWFSQ